MIPGLGQPNAGLLANPAAKASPSAIPNTMALNNPFGLQGQSPFGNEDRLAAAMRSTLGALNQPFPDPNPSADPKASNTSQGHPQMFRQPRPDMPLTGQLPFVDAALAAGLVNNFGLANPWLAAQFGADPAQIARGLVPNPFNMQLPGQPTGPVMDDDFRKQPFNNNGGGPAFGGPDPNIMNRNNSNGPFGMNDNSNGPFGFPDRNNPNAFGGMPQQPFMNNRFPGGNQMNDIERGREPGSEARPVFFGLNPAPGPAPAPQRDPRDSRDNSDRDRKYEKSHKNDNQQDNSNPGGLCVELKNCPPDALYKDIRRCLSSYGCSVELIKFDETTDVKKVGVKFQNWHSKMKAMKTSAKVTINGVRVVVAHLTDEDFEVYYESRARKVAFHEERTGRRDRDDSNNRDHRDDRRGFRDNENQEEPWDDRQERPWRDDPRDNRSGGFGRGGFRGGRGGRGRFPDNNNRFDDRGRGGNGPGPDSRNDGPNWNNRQRDFGNQRPGMHEREPRHGPGMQDREHWPGPGMQDREHRPGMQDRDPRQGMQDRDPRPGMHDRDPRPGMHDREPRPGLQDRDPRHGMPNSKPQPDLISDSIIVTNLPAGTTDRDLCDFFSDIGITPKKLHLMLDDNGQPNGEAFIEFWEVEQARRACGKDGAPLGPLNVMVRLVSKEELMEALGVEPGAEQTAKPLLDMPIPRPGLLSTPRDMEPQQPPIMPPPGEMPDPACVVTLENIPYRSGTDDILAFFSEFNLTPDNVFRKLNERGQPTAEARVVMACPEDAIKAVNTLNAHRIGGRNIFLRVLKNVLNIQGGE